ncbi:MAG: tripartite tricarboxylate transporter substrate binding protein [Paracoccaceae bacterium]|jgi:tripartite-type tricarboxylate transporter receptor subunit TctC|nr:tripartite tricarboxylate transporter substrate binding protein [Paracoccaceae bacterium]
MKYLLTALATALTVALAAPVLSEAYPKRAIEIVVPAKAGGGSDVTVRTLQPYIEKELGVDIVVLNVPGAGSVAGSRRVVDEDPDGHSVLVNHTTLLTAIALGKADFGLDDLELAAKGVSIPLVIVVPGDSPYSDIASIAKASVEGKIIAGVNLGALNHFTMLLVESKVANSNFRYVQTGGGAKTTAALLGGHIDIGVLGASEALRLIESNDARVIAAVSRERIDYLPDVPTAIEQGVDAALSIDFSWYMPKGTPSDRQKIFSDALSVALSDPEVINAFKKRGISPSYTDGPDAIADVRASFADIEAIAASLN